MTSNSSTKNEEHDIPSHILETILDWVVRSWNCGCLVTCFCYQLIAKPGNKTAAVSWPDPYERIRGSASREAQCLIKTHWGQVTHICVVNVTIIGPDKGLSPGRRQAIIWTSAGILLIGPLGTNFGEILIEIFTFSLTKMHLKMSVKWRRFCLGLNVLILQWYHSWSTTV